MKGYTLQPREFTDAIYPDPVDGIREGTRLPYPFHCGEDGTVQRQDFWRGDPIKVIGFQNDRDIQQVDLWWSDFVNTPEAAVGKYIVAVDDRGGMSTYGTTTVRDVTPFEYENAPWEDR